MASIIVLLGAAAYSLWPSRVASAEGMVLVDAESLPDSVLAASLSNFWIDQYEVTNVQYAAVNQEHVYARGEEEHPIRGVTWKAADEYCQKLGKRLPTETEWELAARGPDGWLYPWGNDADVVILPTSAQPVGSVPVNRTFFGAFDMVGSVAEWVNDPYTVASAEEKVSRGGSYAQLHDLSRGLAGDPDSAIMDANTGFRCAASDAEPSSAASLADVMSAPDAETDEFTTEDLGWPNDPGGSIYGYHPSDFYHLSTLGKGQPATSFFSAGVYESFVLEADLFVDEDVSKSGAYRYGLAFRHKDMGYYAFVIALHDQSWAVFKFLEDGTHVTLAEGLNELINGRGHTTSDTEDRLTVIANGPEMSFLIDGQIVSHVSDTDYQSGQVGFYVESLSGDLGHIHFDSLTLQAIRPSANVVAMASMVPATLEPVALEPTATTLPAITPTSAPTIAATSASVEVVPTPSPIPAAPLASSAGMVFIPDGNYVVGDGDVLELAAYWLDRYETTNEEYAQYMADTGVEPPTSWPDGTLPNGQSQYPVQGVTWEAANGYCQWIDKRLPTEPEWEVAARGPHGWLYPWGNSRDLVTLTTAGAYEVGVIPVNRSYFGAFDMAGNVAEWVGASELTVVGASEQVLRGGDFFQPKDMATGVAGDPNAALMVRNAGFRCAASEVEQEEDGSTQQFDFADVTTGWAQAEEETTYFYGYHPTDYYHLNINRPGNCLVLGNELPFDTFIAESTMYLKDSDSVGDFRMGMALSETDQRYYALLISPIEKSWFVVKGSDSAVALLDSGEEETIEGFTEETEDRLAIVAN